MAFVVEGVEGASQLDLDRIEQIGNMLRDLSVKLQVQGVQWFEVPFPKGKRDLSRFVRGGNRLVQINMVRKGTNHGHVERDRIGFHRHGHRKHLARGLRTGPRVRDGRVFDGVGEDVDEYQDIGLREMRELFDRERIVDKVLGDLDRNGGGFSDGFDVPDEGFPEEDVVGVVEGPDEHADPGDMIELHRWLDRVVKNDFWSPACRQ